MALGLIDLGCGAETQGAACEFDIDCGTGFVCNSGQCVPTLGESMVGE